VKYIGLIRGQGYFIIFGTSGKRGGRFEICPPFFFFTLVFLWLTFYHAMVNYGHH
jgi:hypothetical protein